MATRLQEKYTSEVCKGLMEKFNYKNVNELPKLEKVVINIGCGDAVTNSKAYRCLSRNIGEIDRW